MAPSETRDAKKKKSYFSEYRIATHNSKAAKQIDWFSS